MRAIDAFEPFRLFNPAAFLDRPQQDAPCLDAPCRDAPCLGDDILFEGAPYLILLTAIAVAYVVGANLGFSLTFEDHISSPLWPSAGIAVAAFVLWGGKVWPGILVGSAAFHLDQYGLSSIPLALAIGCGNTLGPFLAARALRMVRFNAGFQTPRDVMLFALCGAAAPMMVNASYGVALLVVAGQLPIASAVPNWWTWWVGDTVGVLVVTPLLLTWFVNPNLMCRGLHVLEIAAALSSLILLAALDVTSGNMRLYVFFPLVMWGALRFSQRENATTVFLVAVIMAWGAIADAPATASTSLYDRLTTLDLIIATFAIMTLTGGAVVAERRRLHVDTLRASAGRLQASADRLEESESRFRNAFDSAAIGMAIVSLEGRWLRVNAALCRILGYPEAELLQTNFQSLTHPEDLDSDFTHAEALLQGWITDFHIEKRYFHKNGDTVYALLGVSLVSGADGAPLHFVSQIQDITERRQMEEKLRASQKMEAVGQLTAGIAHDFNNLLAVVALNLELIAGDVAADSFSGDRARIALRSCARGGALTRQLLAFARKQSLSPRSHDLLELMRNSVQLLQHALPDTIAVEVHGAPDVAYHVNIDRCQFENTILNIGLNARDAMATGGVFHLSVTPRQIDKTDSVLPSGRYAEIVAWDSGAGMPPHVLARVFEPFFSTKPFAHGSGLGLSMAYGFIRQSGGDIRITSTEGRGTTVTILLPLPAIVEATAQAA